MLPCAAPCVHLPSSARCTQLLECGHRCPCLESEQCPPQKFCQTCGPSEVLNMVSARAAFCCMHSCRPSAMPLDGAWRNLHAIQHGLLLMTKKVLVGSEC